MGNKADFPQFRPVPLPEQDAVAVRGRPQGQQAHIRQGVQDGVGPARFQNRVDQKHAEEGNTKKTAYSHDRQRAHDLTRPDRSGRRYATSPAPCRGKENRKQHSLPFLRGPSPPSAAGFSLPQNFFSRQQAFGQSVTFLPCQQFLHVYPLRFRLYTRRKGGLHSFCSGKCRSATA